jgi:flagellar basal body-associated protein FliL
MSSRPISTLILALIVALTIGFAIIVVWSLQNRVPPAAGAAKPLSQAPAARIPPHTRADAQTRILVRADQARGE